MKTTNLFRKKLAKNFWTTIDTSIYNSKTSYATGDTGAAKGAGRVPVILQKLKLFNYYEDEIQITNER